MRVCHYQHHIQSALSNEPTVINKFATYNCESVGRFTKAPIEIDETWLLESSLQSEGRHPVITYNVVSAGRFAKPLDAIDVIWL